MLLVYLLLIANGVIGGDLVENLETTLSACSDIIEAVDDFVDSHLTPVNHRRLAEGEDAEPSLVEEVHSQLGACTTVVEAVEEFNKYYTDSENEDEDGDFDEIFKDPIILNVGGKYFTTSLATLQSKNGTFLEQMFQKNTSTTCSSDGSFFINRDPSTFGYVLEYLRNDDMLVRSGDRSVRVQVLEDAEYFQLPDGVKDYLRWSSLDDGMDLSFSEFSFLNKELEHVSKELGGLLYQASKDGSHATYFHQRCDSKGATVVIVETTAGNVFGGYTDQSWSSSSGYRSSSISFLFQLRPAMKRYNNKGGNYHATYSNSGYGPTFGGGHDLHISTNCLLYATSYTNGGHSYYISNNYEMNGGERWFRVQDYAVLQAESL